MSDVRHPHPTAQNGWAIGALLSALSEMMGE